MLSSLQLDVVASASFSAAAQHKNDKLDKNHCGGYAQVDYYLSEKLDGRVGERPRDGLMLHAFLNFDGSSNGNPGPAGAGAVLLAADGSMVYRLREGLGVATNNFAEYRGLILGPKFALKKGFKHIQVQGDSKLVCMQVMVSSHGIGYCCLHLVDCIRGTRYESSHIGGPIEVEDNFDLCNDAHAQICDESSEEDEPSEDDGESETLESESDKDTNDS
ncbi:hypothetical protein T459_34456 [Capsicum annuum]|uniref:RNase H type-1 domain-containing protein n=1 Tax=Capsicum annuum TaxID=4072 RepID=A0A2G2XWJ7_CAPAN|nr:hypothetical protein T459_34456 [Capsicum annuum]